MTITARYRARPFPGVVSACAIYSRRSLSDRVSGGFVSERAWAGGIHGAGGYSTSPSRISWSFRRAAFESRGSLREIARKTSDPDKALRNLLDRDRIFTERLYGEAKRLGLRVIEVDTTMTEDELAERVTGALEL